MDIYFIARSKGIEPDALKAFAMREADRFGLHPNQRLALDLRDEWHGSVGDLIDKWKATQPPLRAMCSPRKAGTAGELEDDQFLARLEQNRISAKRREAEHLRTELNGVLDEIPSESVQIRRKFDLDT